MNPSDHENRGSERDGTGVIGDWPRATRQILSFAALLWVIEAINGAFGHPLNRFGIYPRTFEGLLGIPFWSLLHGGVTHLAVNTTPLVILGWFVALRGSNALFRVSLIVTVAGGDRRVDRRSRRIPPRLEYARVRLFRLSGRARHL